MLRKLIDWLLSRLGSGTKINERPKEIPRKGAFYGIVNDGWWEMDDGNVDKYVRAIHDNGWLGVIVEARGPFAQFGGNDPGVERMLNALERLAKACQKYKVWLWCIDINANSPYVRESSEAMRQFADGVLEKTAAVRRLVLQPVSEVTSTKVDAGKHYGKVLAMFQYYADRTDHPMAWYIGNPSMAAHPPAWVKVCDWHISSTDDTHKQVPGYINTINTDHSSVLAECLEGGREGQRWRIDKLDKLLRVARETDRIAVIYHFRGRTPDYEAIKHGSKIWGDRSWT